MSRCAYITNIDLDSISGGFSAMNRAMFDVLSLEHEVRYIGPVNPNANFWQHTLSKMRRTLGMGGDFFFFSENRLEKIRMDVESRMCGSDAQLAVFHGFTPWIHTRPSLPYMAWNDCTFWQYVHIYHNAKIFRAKDLERIRDGEAEWLRNAERVIFRSSWAAAEATRDYHLDESKVVAIGNYGFLTPPSFDSYEGGRDFLMITTDFRQKGGPVAIEAFRKIREQHPDTRLLLVGSDPGRTVQMEPGVVYLGWVDKSDPEQTEFLCRNLSKVRAIVHPTTADTNPMVLIEAGYFGCPAISTRRCAIPEIVIDGISGILLDDPNNIPVLAEAMIRMLDNDSSYLRMRKEARAHTTGYYTREAFQCRLKAEIAIE